MAKQNVVFTETRLLFNHRKEILPHAPAWMNLDDIMLSEMSQSHKDKYCVTLLPRGTRVVK